LVNGGDARDDRKSVIVPYRMQPGVCGETVCFFSVRVVSYAHLVRDAQRLLVAGAGPCPSAHAMLWLLTIWRSESSDAPKRGINDRIKFFRKGTKKAEIFGWKLAGLRINRAKEPNKEARHIAKESSAACWSPH
jgi:hypothetical protein